MIVHEVFAQVFEAEVKCVQVANNYPEADYITKCIYGPDAFAVDCLQYACQERDKYHDGCFWRVDPETGEETQIPYIPTQEQEVSMLKAENAELTLAMAEVIGGGLDA